MQEVLQTICYINISGHSILLNLQDCHVFCYRKRRQAGRQTGVVVVIGEKQTKQVHVYYYEATGYNIKERGLKMTIRTRLLACSSNNEGLMSVIRKAVSTLWQPPKNKRGVTRQNLHSWGETVWVMAYITNPTALLDSREQYTTCYSDLAEL